MVAFWKNKKVLITGHTGFKGSWLALWLKQLQANVVGYALDPPTPTNLYTVAKVAEGLVDVRGDVRDAALLQQTIATHQPDIIFHLAAQPLVRFSYANPVETYAINVMGTVNVLEAARQLGRACTIVNITTDKCYENKERQLGYQEEDSLGGYDPYSNSKGCAELVTSAYRQSYFACAKERIGLASARAGNVIGGGDWAEDRLLPDLVTACAKAERIKIRYPHAIRPWQHVLEPLSGYLRLAECLYQQPDHYAEAWNFGPNDGEAKSVAWIADEVIQRWGGKSRWEQVESQVVHEATYLTLNCTKAREKLQWQPKWTIQQALQATIAWYQAFYRDDDMQALTLKQIREYLE